MSLHLQLPQTPEAALDQLHPVVLVAAAALLIWFVAAAWLLFGGSGYIDLALAVISVLVFVIIAIPTAFWLAKDRSSSADSTVSNEHHATGETRPLGWWLQGEFATCSGQEKCSAAAAEILLPIAAVAFAVTALGVVFDLIRAGAI